MDMNKSVQRRTHNGHEQECAGEDTQWTGTSAGWGLKVDHGAVTPGKAGGGEFSVGLTPFLRG